MKCMLHCNITMIITYDVRYYLNKNTLELIHSSNLNPGFFQKEKKKQPTHPFKL